MDFNATIDLIIKDLDDARKIIDDLKKYPGVPILQVELAKAKCKSAGEVISLLKSLNYLVDEIPQDISEQHQTEFVQPEEKISPESPVQEMIFNLDAPPENEPLKSTEYQQESDPQTIEKRQSEQSQKKIPESKIIADKFSHLSNRFNEQMGKEKGEDDRSDFLNSKPVLSLSEAIGINDKFLFIREIFNNDRESYDQVISQLEKSESLSDARAVILSYTGNSDENEAINQLLGLVKRKLQHNE